MTTGATITNQDNVSELDITKCIEHFVPSKAPKLTDEQLVLAL